MNYRFVVVALAAVGAIFWTYFIVHSSRSRFWLFHPLALYLGISLVDSLLPAAIWALSDFPASLPTASILTYEDLMLGLLFYIVGYGMLILGFAVGPLFAPRKRHSRPWRVRTNRYWQALLATLTCSLGQLALDIANQGGLTAWYNTKLLLRWDPNFVENQRAAIWEIIFQGVPFRMIFNLLVLVGFFYRKDFRRKAAVTYLGPALGFLLTLTTFYRGSSLLFGCGLAFVEYMRRQRLDLSVSGTARGARGGRRFTLKLLAVFGAIFLVYGAGRDRMSADASGGEYATGSTIVRVLSQGSGIYGAAQIVKHYGEDVAFWHGKTYIDMLLLPVPRAIYTSKPLWYGIDDITRAMGWPESTESAVSMPGEAYANFGWLGSVIMLVWGFGLWLIYRLCASSDGGPLLFVYAGVGLYAVFISNWMSFTGLANMYYLVVFSLPLCGYVLRPAERGTPRRGDFHAEAHTPARVVQEVP